MGYLWKKMNLSGDKKMVSFHESVIANDNHVTVRRRIKKHGKNKKHEKYEKNLETNLETNLEANFRKSKYYVVQFNPNDLHYTETFSLFTIEEIQQRCQEIIDRYDRLEKNISQSDD